MHQNKLHTCDSTESVPAEGASWFRSKDRSKELCSAVRQIQHELAPEGTAVLERCECGWNVSNHTETESVVKNNKQSGVLVAENVGTLTQKIISG